MTSSLRVAAGFQRDRARAVLRTDGPAIGGFFLLALALALHQVRTAAGPDGAETGVALVLGAVALGSALFQTQGIVSTDIARGSALLWLQRPVFPLRHYLARLAEAVAGATVLTLLFAGILAGVLVLVEPASARGVVRYLPPILLLVPPVAATIFAFSAFRIRRDGSAAFVYALVTVTLVALSDGSGAFARLAFPLDPYVEIVRHVVAEGALGPRGALFHLLLFTAGATAVGACGVALTTRAPFPEDQSR